MAAPAIKSKAKAKPMPIYFVIREVIDPVTGQRIGAMVPASDADKAMMRERSFRRSTKVRAVLTQPRNERFNRLVHGLGAVLAANLDRFTGKQAHAAVKALQTEALVYCDEEVFDLPKGHEDEGQAIAGYFFWLYPNIMFNFYPWGLSLNIVAPMSVDQTRVTFKTYILDENKYNQGAGSDLHTVEMEDEAIVEWVQKGTKSRAYTHGRYSAVRETGPHHFHRLLAMALND